MSKKILCLHHTDLDGAMSGAIVGYWALKSGYEIVYQLYNYGYPIEKKDFDGYDLVFAVDVSFGETDPWVYSYLRSKLVWIDHHKSAIDFRNDNPELFKGVSGVQSIGVGACELTWNYLFPESITPKLVQYLSAYDVWDKERFDWKTVEQIQWGTRLEYGISAKDLCNYLRLLEINITDYLGDLRSDGEKILKYAERNYKSKLKSYGSFVPEFTVEGLGKFRVMMLNTNEFTSKAFESLFNPDFYDIMMPYCICSKEKEPGEFEVRFSLYTDKDGIDVSKIAGIFGGGGHIKAAGGKMSLETLKKILESSMSLKEYDNWLRETLNRK